MKQNIEDNVGNFINNIEPGHNVNNKFYVKDSIWKTSQGKGNFSSKNEILQDYLENTEYSNVVSVLLNKRLNWTSVSENNTDFDYSYTGSDMFIKSNAESLKTEDWEELAKEEKEDIIEKYINKQEKVYKKTPTTGTSFNRDIQTRSRINNRIPKLTRLVGNKYTFYSIIKENNNGHDKMIPEFTIFTTKTEDYKTKVQQFLDLSHANIFLLRPLAGVGGLGFLITKKENLTRNIVSHVSKKFKNKFTYKKWMVSEFKQSFLWKLNNLAPDSNVLLKENPARRHQFVGRNLELWNKDKVPFKHNLEKNFTVKYPSRLSHVRYTDTVGRINKGRIWFVYQVKDTSLIIHIYNKLQFELSPEEFQYKFDDPYSFIPDLGRDYYKETLNMDKINAGRASDLNLSFILDWDSGKGFPLGKSKWEKMKQNLKYSLHAFVESIKDTTVCMSYANKDIQTLGCYQLFSLDFIVDNDANAWLLECNTRPWVGHGKWWKKFDPDTKHVNDKWEFFDSMFNLTVDSHIKPKTQKIDYKKHWTKIVEKSKKKFDNPVVYIKRIAPIEGINKQTNLGKNIITSLNNRGWSIFPWKKYLEKPDFVWQGMTPLLKNILDKETYDKSKIVRAYPDLLKAGVINRVFPLAVYLGNKSMLIKVLKQKLPNWHNVIPWSFPIYKNKKDWKEKIEYDFNKMKTLYKKKSLKLIVKPSHGLQGIGIFISDDINHVISHINQSDDDEWIGSLYIDNPLLLKKKKNHIRVFVLVHRDKKGINGYLFGRHFVFMAPMDYDKCQKSNFPTEDKDYCNLTNLAVGARYYEKIGKDPKDAYADLSGIAQDEFDGDNFNQSQYSNFRKTEKYKKMKMEFYTNNKKLKEPLPETYYNIVMLPQIKEIVHDTIYAASPYITCIQEKEKNFEGCFQYTAFDLMFDDGDQGKLMPKCWLLEVNTSPGLKATTAQGSERVFQFLNNMFDIVIHKREKAPKSGEFKQLFKKIYTLDKQVTPKLVNLVSDHLIFEKIKDKYQLPDLSKYKHVREIPKYVKKVKLPDSLKKKLQNMKKHPKVDNCLCKNEKITNLKSILKSNKIPYSGLNKMQMCYLINKMKLKKRI